jgi:GxxExxY protein
MNTELLFRDEVYAIVGAAMEVHGDLSGGYLEAVHQEAMEIELSDRTVPFARQQKLRITYKGRTLEKFYVADLVCYGAVLVEIKTLDRLSGKEESQILNYLKTTGLRVGQLLNFGNSTSFEWKRFVR